MCGLGIELGNRQIIHLKELRFAYITIIQLAMEVSLAQENRCFEKEILMHDEDREDFNSTEIVPFDSVGTSRGKRNNLRKWFHRTVFGGDVDEHIDNEDTVVLEDDDDLVFIPTFPDISNNWLSLEKDVPPSLFEQSPDRKNYRRQKIKDFKAHMKIKMHLTNDNDFNKGDGFPCRGHLSLKQKNRDERGSDDDHDSDIDNDNEALDCYQMFKTQPEDLDALFDYTMRSSPVLRSSSELTVFNGANSPIRELQPFQNLEYDDIKSIKDPIESCPLFFWDNDLGVDGGCSNNSNDKKILNSCSNSKEEDDCPMSSTDSVEIETIASAPLEKSSQKTPPVYLASESTINDEVENDGVSNDNFNTTEDGKLSCEISQDTQNTLCSSGSPEIESDCDSGDSNTIIYTIPTFKQRRGELNVSCIVKSFREGTLTKRNLNRMARATTANLSFRSKEFYEQPPSSDEDSAEQCSGHDEDIQGIFHTNEDGAKTPESNSVDSVGNGGGVKFDNYSHILVYRAVKRNAQNKGFNCPTFRSSNSGNGILTIRVGESPSVSKPILKKRGNEREAEEITRATHCDKVDVKSFMNYFDRFEYQKRSEESSLGKVRERQLSHYYSKEFFPELLEDTNFKNSLNSEYKKSKKATEFNIGRKIDSGDERRVRHLVNVMENSK